MSLKGRARRVTATLPSDHIWITNDMLNHAFRRYLRLRPDLRHGSAIPGPLEARRRSAKRKMMGAAPATAGPALYPGFLPGVSGERQDQLVWPWPTSPPPYPPDEPSRNNEDGQDSRSRPSPSHKSADPSVPRWLEGHDELKDDEYLLEDVGIVSDVDCASQDSRELHVISADPNVGKPAKGSSEIRPEDKNMLKTMRLIYSSLNGDDPLRKRCIYLAFQRLIQSGVAIDRILEFWGGPSLDPWSGDGLFLLLEHSVQYSKVEWMKRISQWIVQQIHLGISPDRYLLLALTNLSRLRDSDQCRDIFENFCKSVVQTLLVSPVVHGEDLEPNTFSSLLQALLNHRQSHSIFNAGCDLLREATSVQLQCVQTIIWPILEEWIHPWELNGASELDTTELIWDLIAVLRSLPEESHTEAIEAISRKILEAPLPKFDELQLWRRHALSRSASRTTDVLDQDPDCWHAIHVAIRQRQEDIIESMAVRMIDYQMNNYNALATALLTFARHPQVTLESCPGLAEALILDPDQHWVTAMHVWRRRQSRMLSKIHHAHVSDRVQQLRQDGGYLLNRMALAYAYAPHLQPNIAFNFVHECWALHEPDRFGPVGSSMIRAVVHSGIVRPLQEGQVMSYARLNWILQQVAQVEGTERMRSLGSIVWEWRSTVIRQIRQSQKRYGEELANARWEQDQATAELIERDPRRWDALSAVVPRGSSKFLGSEKHENAMAPMATTPSLNVSEKVSHITNRAPWCRQSVTPQPLPVWTPEQPSQLSSDQYQAREEDITAKAETTSYYRVVRTGPHDRFATTENISVSRPSWGYRRLSGIQASPSRFPGLVSVQEHSARDAALNLHIANRTLRQPAVSDSPTFDATYTASDLDSAGGTPLRPVASKDTREEALDRHARAQDTIPLWTRLNAAPEVGIGRQTISLSFRREFLPIRPCRLPTDRGQLRSNGTRRPLLGLEKLGGEPSHGMKEYDGPNTPATAEQPTLGKGSLSVAWVLEKAAQSERRKELRSRSTVWR
ncbi:MAG: hypothetical protein Q9174_000285 [Haloplaca sp. 1 TL-2023]